MTEDKTDSNYYSKTMPGRGRRKLPSRLERRLRRGYVLVAARKMNLRFPTVNAYLSEEKRDELKAQLAAGDILLKDDCKFPLAQLSASVFKSFWIHSGVYAGSNEVIDIGSKPYVSVVNVDEFLKASKIAILRPRYKDSADVQSALSFLRNKLGKPFNSKFDLTKTNSFYCTQLIYETLKQLPNAIELHVSQVFGKPAILYSDIESSKDIELVSIAKISRIQQLFAHAPSYSALIAGGSLAWKLNPSLTFPGSFTGLAALLFLNNKPKQKHKKSLSAHAN